MIPVTKAYLPNKKKYQAYIERIYDSGWLTNNGSTLQTLEQTLAKYLGVKHLICVANGSLALQLAYKVLDLKGEVITTPFSFAATSNTLAWEGLKPVFADIDTNSYNLNPDNVHSLVTERTSAILPVHVFGNPCEIEKIEEVARQYDLKVVYDAAHAFGCKYKGGSVLNHGDISTISFHATKMFHTIEGGAVITNDDKLAEKTRQLINFGIESQDKIKPVGTNAKMNEFEAAMGLCVLDEIQTITEARMNIWERYQKNLEDIVSFQTWNKHSLNNHSYAPVLFDTEARLLETEALLRANNIIPRRYFYPSLDTLGYSQMSETCNQSKDISSRILCLPIYPGLSKAEQDRIIKCVRSA